MMIDGAVDNYANGDEHGASRGNNGDDHWDEVSCDAAAGNIKWTMARPGTREG